jgi:CBS domain-containing protein
MAQVNEQLAQRTADEVMTSDPHSIYAGASPPQALITMIEWYYEQVPVTNREGAFAGLLDGNALLRAVLEDSSTAGDTDSHTPVQLVMQSVVPRIQVTQPLPIALRHLLTTTGRYLMVVDETGHVQGILNDSIVLQHLNDNERLLWLAALQSQTPVDIAALPGEQYSLHEVMQRNVATLSPATSIIDSVRLLLEHHAERLPVVDEEGKLLGILARSGLLRALMQESQ